jgi:hypothetical protein
MKEPMIHLDERDLCHLMSVCHGAVISFAEDGDYFLKIKVVKQPIIETLYPTVPARVYAIDRADLDKLLAKMNYDPSKLYWDDHRLRLSKPFNAGTVYCGKVANS